MKISHIRIQNILGVDELEFEPGAKFTEIAGRNGSRKTSVLDAIKAVLETGHDATLLRKGAEKGEAVLVLDDGTEIRRRVSASGSTTEVRREGKKIAKPVEAIRALTDMLSMNPIDFLRAPKKDRVRVLLETLPLEADTEKLAEISGVPVNAAPGMHALAVVDAVYKQVYDDRTLTNRAVREKEATINQLRAAMPAAPGGVEGDEDELRAQIAAAQDAMRAEHQRIDTKLSSMRVASAEKVQKIKDEARAKIDAINAELAAAIEAERAALAETESKAARVRQKASDTCTATVQPLSDAVKAIVADRDAAAKRKATLETIHKMDEELESLKTDTAKQTQALADIEQYKHDLLSSLPIPGLEVKDGEIYRDGVALDRLNTAQQVDIAVEIAKLRAGKLGVICVDGIEALDSESYEAFRDRALESDLQMFVTRVADSDFSINPM